MQEEELITQTLDGWIMDHVQKWRDHYDQNYETKFDEYNRIWRGIWDGSDKTRDSERSKIVSPATQQAVESSVAEIEEATFGRGRFFDIKDNDDQPEDIVSLRETLAKEFEKTKVRKAVSECLINAAVFGTGIGEIVLDEETRATPATQPIMDGELQAVGINIEEVPVVRLRPIKPQNFLIEPVAASIEEALGVAIDEFVPPHSVENLQESGVYRDVPIYPAAEDFDIEPDKEIQSFDPNKVRLTKYYGLVPRKLLKASLDDNDVLSEGDSYYVEAIVVLGNENVILKAIENPYMMQDRPVIAFPWDVVPSRFWGRGVCEKGYNSQKALDAELRARIDALALTIHPMMAMDATRIPRGFTPEVKPGKMFLTNGAPSEVLQPFNFGQVSQITFAQADALQKMVQTATGAIDSAGIPGSINGEATAAGISMSLGAIIKRHKRTLINFQENFLIPFVEKSAWRYMQYAPERFPARDYSFHATSTLGIIAREYEVTQLVQLLQTMDNNSPVYSTLIESIIDNMNLSNREELIALVKQASQSSPEEQQAQQAAQQAQIDFQNAQTATLVAQAEEFKARAGKYAAETQAIPQNVLTDRIEAIADLEEDTDKEFNRRLKLADKMLEERRIETMEQKQQKSS